VYQQYGHYYLCQAQLTWLPVISDSAIAFAYYLFPIMVVYSPHKRQDFIYQCIYIANSVLFIICSTKFFRDLWLFWHLEYWLLDLLKAIAASSSVCTMILLMRSLPQFLTIFNLTELKQVNQQLELEIKERHFAEEALRESKERFHNAFDYAAIGMALVGLKGSWLQVNHALCEIIGYSETELLAKTCQDITHAEDLDTEFDYVRQLLTGEIRCYHIEKRYIHKLGHVIWILLSVSLVCDIHGQPLYFITQIQDITECKQLEQRNHEIALLSQMSDILQACLTVEEAYKVIAQLIQPLFPQTSGGVFMINSSKHFVEAVTTWGDLTVASKTVFSAKQCWALRRGRAHFSTSEQQSLHCSHIEESFAGEALCVPMMAQGEALGMLHFHSPEKGQLTAAKQQLASAVAERVALALANLRLTEALRQQSIRDPLTGLFNRRYLEESLEREISRAERSHKHVGIIMIDVDHFKSFNDKFGHEVGDVVLRELGGFLKKQIRKADIACRYGGEEIMLILPESSLEVCQQRAERIRQTVKLLALHHQHQKLDSISLSLGVAMYPEHGITGAAVIEAADTALYIAKKTGRDRVVIAQSQV
jgi:diguanylate cyclase (GGDEF)-like protein/PAS domain S-box-containing protein